LKPSDFVHLREEERRERKGKEGEERRERKRKRNLIFV